MGLEMDVTEKYDQIILNNLYNTGIRRSLQVYLLTGFSQNVKAHFSLECV
jgi:hypothetical protein